MSPGQSVLRYLFAPRISLTVYSPPVLAVSDEGWYGWWSSGAVYGVFEASPEEDGLPVHGRANGYASLWVKSASDVANLVRVRGGGFPHIPAINDKAGVDHQPGYAQATCTDLDGNVFLATEYTGRRN